MATSLNKKYGIPFASDWINKFSGQKVTALLIAHCFGEIKIPVVSFVLVLNEAQRDNLIKNNIKNQFVMTVEEFKHSFLRLHDDTE
jgi:hypothetical protein